ncbi:hypothetical protein PPIS_a1710 [Pseudoalteromonas piscicida]|uniref:Uncharacterized protein n=1 Tax=Pseudoalteromonas piscicida TaxID=43662 RepID=A0ABN5CB50_PSEO7|nr:hypothetical protein PPIS_a1710 [Pseudoalteromonas piscicida]
MNLNIAAPFAISVTSLILQPSRWLVSNFNTEFRVISLKAQAD